MSKNAHPAHDLTKFSVHVLSVISYRKEQVFFWCLTEIFIQIFLEGILLLLLFFFKSYAYNDSLVCNPDTLIDFEGDELEAFTDKSGNRNGIGKENVRLKDGTGFFYGVGKISFWRYANVELGPLLGIQIRFFPYGYSKNPMGLVSNCNGSPIGSTVDIRLDTKTKQAIFKLSTNKQRNNQIVLPYEVSHNRINTLINRDINTIGCILLYNLDPNINFETIQLPIVYKPFSSNCI